MAMGDLNQASRPSASLFRILLVAIVLFALLATLVVLVPFSDCPSCIDLGISLFKCDICGGGGGQTKKLSLLKRWKSIRMLEREGSRYVPLFR